MRIPCVPPDASDNYQFFFDNNGNTTSKTASGNTTNYSWDYENRLTQVTLPNSGGTVSFKYDPFGRRIEKISPTATSIFLYDGDNLVETVNASGSEVASYAQDEGIDEPLAMDRSGTVDYYEQDGVNSVTSLTATNGSVAQSYTYDSFGNTTNSSGSLTNFFRYTGRDFDTETNVYYYRARYYDPTIGRFITQDPVSFVGGINFYRYVANDPVGFSDPLGFDPTGSCGTPDCKKYLQFKVWSSPLLYVICKFTPQGPKPNCVRRCLLNSYGPGPNGQGRYFDPPLYFGSDSEVSNAIQNFQNGLGPITHLRCFVVCGYGPF